MRKNLVIGMNLAMLLVLLTGCHHSVTPPPAPTVSYAPPMTPALAAQQQAKQYHINGIKQMARLRGQLRARNQHRQ
jgi:hypothetical protein